MHSKRGVVMIDFNKLKEQEFAVKKARIVNNKIVPIADDEITALSLDKDLLYLIYPNHIGAQWTNENMVYRSSIWTLDGAPVSLGFKKFFNYNEKPNLVPDPVDLTKCFVKEKIDGSTIIISRYKGIPIIRTRGTFDASGMDNGYEIEYLKQKYPNVFENELLKAETHSILLEWVSPDNKIVLSYGDEPDAYLIGIVKHDDYTYLKQSELIEYGVKFGIQTSNTYHFRTITEMIETVQAFKGKEGVCVYFNKEQDIKKIKGLEYLALHAFKGQVSAKNLIELFLEYGMPDYNTFMSKIEAQFDFECAQMARSYVSKISDAFKDVKKIKEGMERFVIPLKILSRKEAALKIMEAYGNTNRSGFAFKLLDGNDFTKDMYKKLLFQTVGESE
jgi:hypothetical protein